MKLNYRRTLLASAITLACGSLATPLLADTATDDIEHI